MNARQKAKKYKRLYEDLMRRPIEFCVEPHKIGTLRVEKCYPEELVATLMMILRKKENCNYINPIQKDIAQGLAEGLDKYITYRTDYDPGMKVYRVCGELKVVDR